MDFGDTTCPGCGATPIVVKRYDAVNVGWTRLSCMACNCFLHFHPPIPSAPYLDGLLKRIADLERQIDELKA